MKIYGASDDLIEIENGPSGAEEWNVLDKATHGVLIGASNGALIRVRYEKDGIWRITSLAQGHNGAITTILRAEHIQVPEGRESYSDMAVLDTGNPLVPFEWVAQIRKVIRKKRT